MLTDTTFWIDLLEERRKYGHKAALQRGPAHAFLASHRAHELSVSIVTWEELAEGVDNPAAMDALLQGVRILLLPKQVAWETSRIQREVGRRLGENDAWLAGTARAWGMRLVTRDAAFARVRRLNCVAY